MKQLGTNLKAGEIKVQAENADDLWTLSHIIDQGDVVSGKTLRKIKLGEQGDRNTKIIKKPVFLKIEVEKMDLSPEDLRVSGPVHEGTDDISKGSYHTFNVETGSTITITKERWLSYQLSKLKEACEGGDPKILILVHDREEAYFALLKKYGYEVLLHLRGDVQKKKIDVKHTSGFYGSLIKQLQEYDARYSLERVILASPAFFKEDLLKELKDDTLKKKIVPATCNSVDKTGINEVLKREETKEALRLQRSSQEMKYVEELLSEISKTGKAAYGIKEVVEKANAGAISTLLVTDKLIFSKREEGTFVDLDHIMKLVDSMKGDIHIISSEHDGGKRLDGLGGIGAILRY